MPNSRNGARDTQDGPGATYRVPERKEVLKNK